MFVLFNTKGILMLGKTVAVKLKSASFNVPVFYYTMLAQSNLYGANLKFMHTLALSADPLICNILMSVRALISNKHTKIVKYFEEP